MPGVINVDTTDESVSVTFVDDKGNVTAAPSGATATFASDDEGIATVATNPSDPLKGDVAPVGVGTCDLSVAFNGTALEIDGSPIPDPDPVSLEVDPGAAAGARLTLAE